MKRPTPKPATQPLYAYKGAFTLTETTLIIAGVTFDVTERKPHRK
jgi:hypothetical protein